MAPSGAAEPPVWLDNLGHSPTLIRAYWAQARALLLEGVLPCALKEVVVRVIALESGAEHADADDLHATSSPGRALARDDSASIPDPAASAPVTHAHRLAVDFAARVAHDPDAVSDDDFVALREVGFDDAEINELLGVIDLAMLFLAAPRDDAAA